MLAVCMGFWGKTKTNSGLTVCWFQNFEHMKMAMCFCCFSTQELKKLTQLRHVRIKAGSNTRPAGPFFPASLPSGVSSDLKKNEEESRQ